MKKYIFIILCAFALPTSAFAATTHFTCADLTLDAGGSCTGSTITFDAGNERALGSYTTTAATYYFSFVATQTGGTGVIKLRNYSAGSPVTDYNAGVVNGTYTDVAVSMSGGGDQIGVANLFAGAWVGTIANLCVSDTPGACAAAPPTPGPSSVPLASVIATSSLSMVGSWSGALFKTMGDGGLIEAVAGLLIGGMVAAYFFGAIPAGVGKVTNRKQRKR